MSEPNFEIYDNPTGILVGTVVLEVVAVTCVTLRFYQRCWQNVRCLASDWVILVALVFGTGLSVMEIYGENMSFLNSILKSCNKRVILN